MGTKLIVSNRQALKTKYGASIDSIDQALARLQAADAGRGITTDVVYLDDAAQMAAHAAPPVTQPSDPVQNKEAIDGVWNARRPDYLLILGAPDVVPHQRLANPVQEAGEDPDVPSDLPYASAAGFSTSISAFRDPTRVVGRLPDVTGASSPGVIVSLLDRAAAFTPPPASVYAWPFAVSTDRWQLSTRTSVTSVFGAGAVVRLSPPDGPAWSLGDYHHRVHFINCHGRTEDPHWYGHSQAVIPVAFDAARVAGNLLDGTIVAAECCYGAELYDPVQLSSHPSMCSTYLESGACAFWGSTNISYGSPTAQPSGADIIAQRFLFHVRQGGSIGAAALQARLDFINGAGPTLDPLQMKTIAQFILLGDPSLQPIALLPPGVDPGSPGFLDALEALRRARRQRFLLQGEALAERTGFAVLTEIGDWPVGFGARLRTMAAAAELPDAAIYTYDVRGPERYIKARADTGGPDAYYVLLSRIETGPDAPFPMFRALVVAREGETLRPVTVMESR